MRRGFTLLEVMVSLSILAIALTAASGINVGSFASASYAKDMTIATLLARSKMIDIEEDLRREGFSDQERSLDGDFEEEGRPSYRWEAVVRPVDVDIAELITNLFEGDLEGENLPDEMQDYLSAYQGEGSEELQEQVQGSDISQLVGGEQTAGFIRQISETLSDGIREVRLDIAWGPKGKKQESLQFVQYVTTSGRLNRTPQRPGAQPPANGQSGQNGQNAPTQNNRSTQPVSDQGNPSP